MSQQPFDPRGRFAYWLRQAGILPLLAVSVLSVLSGCSAFKDKTLVYQEAKVVSPITTPEGVAMPRRGQAYPVPGLNRSTDAQDPYIPTLDAAVPRNLREVGVSGFTAVTLKRDAQGRPFLVVSRSKADVYSSVKSFIEVNKLAVENVDEVSGVITLSPLKPLAVQERPWWQFGEARPQKEQFTLKVVHQSDKSAHVVMTHHILEQQKKGDWKTIRTNHPDDARNAEAVLSDLSHYIDADDREWRSPMVARRYESLPKIVRSTDGTGYPVITVVSDYNSAWSRVETVLQSSREMKLEDKNRSEGVFLVKTADAEGLLQLRLDKVETGVVITLQRDDNTLAPLPLTESLMKALENALQA